MTACFSNLLKNEFNLINCPSNVTCRGFISSCILYYRMCQFHSSTPTFRITRTEKTVMKVQIVSCFKVFLLVEKINVLEITEKMRDVDYVVSCWILNRLIININVYIIAKLMAIKISYRNNHHKCFNYIF